jgi:hypothetical protein
MTAVAHDHLVIPLAGTEHSQHGSAVNWAEPEPGFWVAARAGDFVGTVTIEGIRYIARGATGAPVGDFDTLAAAQASLTPVPTDMESN